MIRLALTCPPEPMPRGAHIKFDREAFHAYLFDRANSKGEIIVVAHELASLLDCQYRTIGRILAELGEQGKVKKLGRASRPQGSGCAGWNYWIQDPGTVSARPAAPAPTSAPKGRRVIQWG